MRDHDPVTPSPALLGSGVLSLLISGGLLAAMDFGAPPGAGFAALSILLLLAVLWGIVGTVLGLATIVPGHAR